MGFLLVFSVFFVILILNQLVVIFHEFGHALAVTLLTNSSKITVLIGTHNKDEAQINFKLFKYHFYFRFDLFGLNGGYVSHNLLVDSVWKEVVIIISGILLPFLLSVFLFYFFQNNIEKYPFLRIVSIFLIISNLVSIYINIFKESTTKYEYFNGTDGQLLLKLIKYGYDFIKFQNAIRLFSYDDFRNCELLLLEIHNKIKEPDVIRYLAYSTYHQQKFIESDRYLEDLSKHYTLNASDYNYKFCNLELLKRYDDILDFFKNQENINELDTFLNINNIIAYCYIEKEMFEVALPYCEKAVEKYPNEISTLINNGYCNLKLGFVEKGYKYLIKAEKIEPKNPNVYSNFSYYFCIKKDKELALLNLSKSKELGLKQEYFDEINELIKML